MNPNNLSINVDGIGAMSAPLQIVLLLTLISFLPAILVTMTSFTRIAIVFHFLRQALGTQEMPSNQILIGLALFLTMFIMAPVGAQINQLAVEPTLAGRMNVTEAIAKGIKGAKLEIVENCAHMGMIEKPESYTKLLAAILD